MDLTDLYIMKCLSEDSTTAIIVGDIWKESVEAVIFVCFVSLNRSDCLNLPRTLALSFEDQRLSV